MNDSAIGKTLKLVGALIAGAWGAIHPLMQVLLVLMVVDVFTGLLAGIVTRSVSSDASFKGMAKKTLIVILCATTEIVTRMLDSGIEFAAIVAGFYCIHEALSITENVTRAGLPLPKQLTEVLQKLRQQAE